MDRDNDWKQAFFALLKHFDDCEGTTYLYDAGTRRLFYRDVPESVLPQVIEAVELYHKR